MDWQPLESSSHLQEVAEAKTLFLVMAPLEPIQVKPYEAYRYVDQMGKEGYRLEYGHRRYGCYVRALSQDGEMLP